MITLTSSQQLHPRGMLSLVLPFFHLSIIVQKSTQDRTIPAFILAKFKTALFMGTATQLRAVSFLKSVSVTDVDLPVADSMRVLGVTLDRRLTFDNHASAVARSCNYHAREIRHIRHLLTLDLAQTLACNLILSRIDYCNSVLHGASSSTIQKLQRVQNKASRIGLQAPRR